MPLDEREKKELTKKIAEQRRSMWKGEITEKRQTRKKREFKKEKRVSDSQKEHEKVEQTQETHHTVMDDESAGERQEVEQAIKPQYLITEEYEEIKPTSEYQRKRRKTSQTSDRRSGKPKKEKVKNRDTQSSVPSLKLALLVIVGLISAVVIGVTIGYLAAVRNLVKI